MIIVIVGVEVVVNYWFVVLNDIGDDGDEI